MVFVLLVSILFDDPFSSLYWWAVSVGGEELKWCQLAHHQVMSSQRPQFSPHSTAKANDKNTNLRRNVFASVYSEKTRLKKLIMIIIIIMNNSQKTTVFSGRQKLTSPMKQRPEK